MNTENIVEVLTLTLKKMDLLNAVKRFSTEQIGQIMMPFARRLAVWKYWHSVGTASTLTSRPAKQKISVKSKIQTGLEYHDVAEPVIQCNHMFMEDNWYTVNETIKCLYSKYSSENPDSPVSYGTFLKFKPFYVRSVTTKFVEMCCCEKNLHVRWAVSTLLQLCKQQKFEPSFIDYYSFFNAISSSCAKAFSIRIVLKIKRFFCSHASKKWSEIKKLIEKCDPNKTVRMQHFIKVKAMTKKGKEVTKLTATGTNGTFKSFSTL